MTTTLLPPSATPFERALEAATAVDGRIVEIPAIRRAKLDVFPPYIPWLLWEYGLGELLPYLPDPVRAIAEGVQWQRLRGTPAALRIALGWRGWNGAVLVEEDAGGPHWAEFQLDPGTVLVNDDDIDDITALAALAAPVRSRLSRLYHGYDMRRVIVDHTGLDDGSLLDDYSGIHHQTPAGEARLSFGRLFPSLGRLAAPLPLVHSARVHGFGFYVRPLYEFILDHSVLEQDDWHLPNPQFQHGRLYGIGNLVPLVEHAAMRPERRVARAEVVLDDGWPLEDTNSRFHAAFEGVAGDDTLVLDADRLDALKTRPITIEWNEAFDRATGCRSVTADQTVRRAYGRVYGGQVKAPYQFTLDGTPQDDEWHALDPDLRPIRINSPVNAPIHAVAPMRPGLRFARAEVILDDGAVLDDVNARFHAAFKSVEGDSLFVLDDTGLDTNVARPVTVPWTEAHHRERGAGVVHSGVASTAFHTRERVLPRLVNSHDFPVLDEPYDPAFVASVSITRQVSSSAERAGTLPWVDAYWPDSSRNTTSEITERTHGRIDA